MVTRMIFCSGCLQGVSCSNNEMECFQDGMPFFDVYKQHVPSTQHVCFSFSSSDFYTKVKGTRNVRISDDGCDGYDDSDSGEEL